MSKWLKALGLAAVVAVGAVIVPLYGDPRSSSVEHGEWARMLLRALDMERSITASTPDVQLFSILSWKTSLAFRADAYFRGEGVEVLGPTGETRVVAAPASGEVAYPLAVVKGGDYRLRLRMAGNPATPVAAEITGFGHSTAAATFALAPAAIAGWVDSAPAHLDPGAYTAAIQLPPGTSLERVEVVPPCTEAIEPQGGWRSRAETQTEDVAVTAVKALDKQSELPAAGPAVEVSAASMHTTGGTAAGIAQLGSAGEDRLWLRGGPQGLQAIAYLDLPEPGLYTVSVFGLAGAGQSWKADSCRKAVWCGTSDVAASAAGTPAWHPIMTATFTPGRHFFNVTLGQGASVQRLRAEPKKDSPADYVATLKKLGFDVGPSGPISRARAIDAMHFIEQRHIELSGVCGDIVPPMLVAGLTEPAPIPGPGTGPGYPGVTPELPGTPNGPTPPATAPPEPPPTTVPVAPSPEPSPTAPPPTTPPPPTTVPVAPTPPPPVPTQPPGSPVLPWSNP